MGIFEEIVGEGGEAHGKNSYSRIYLYILRPQDDEVERFGETGAWKLSKET